MTDLNDDLDAKAAIFTGERGRLLNLAYRLTGSWADAEDVVSDAWPKWQVTGPGEIRTPAAWLTTVVSRLALDLLRSARSRREHYVGPWLPEPVLQQLDGSPLSRRPADPASIVEVDESVRLAFLVVLDELAPQQRVAFVLHDVLDVPFSQVAEVLECSVEAARQQASRARRRVREAQPPPVATSEQVEALLQRLAEALAEGDIAALSGLLTEDVNLVSDGAGEVFAARRPLHGTEVAKFLLGIGKQVGSPGFSFVPALVNGEPGVVYRLADAKPGQPAFGAYAVTIRDGRVCDLYIVVAPAKLPRPDDIPGL